MSTLYYTKFLPATNSNKSRIAVYVNPNGKADRLFVAPFNRSLDIFEAHQEVFYKFCEFNKINHEKDMLTSLSFGSGFAFIVE